MYKEGGREKKREGKKGVKGREEKKVRRKGRKVSGILYITRDIDSPIRSNVELLFKGLEFSICSL